MKDWFYERHTKGINLRLWYANRMDERIPLGEKPLWWRQASRPKRWLYTIRAEWSFWTKGYYLEGYYW